MTTIQEVRDIGNGLRVEYEESGQIRTEEINSMDELLTFHLSEKPSPHVFLIQTCQLLSSSKASGATLKFIATVIPGDIVAHSLEVNPRSLAQLCRRKSLSRTQTEVLEDLTCLWGKIQQKLFGGDQWTMQRWLDIPVPALDGETPKNLMGTVTGRKIVEKHVRMLKYGDYS